MAGVQGSNGVAAGRTEDLTQSAFGAPEMRTFQQQLEVFLLFFARQWKQELGWFVCVCDWVGGQKFIQFIKEGLGRPGYLHSPVLSGTIKMNLEAYQTPTTHDSTITPLSVSQKKQLFRLTP